MKVKDLIKEYVEIILKLEDIDNSKRCDINGLLDLMELESEMNRISIMLEHKIAKKYKVSFYDGCESEGQAIIDKMCEDAVKLIEKK